MDVSAGDLVFFASTRALILSREERPPGEADFSAGDLDLVPSTRALILSREESPRDAPEGCGAGVELPAFERAASVRARISASVKEGFAVGAPGSAPFLALADALIFAKTAASLPWVESGWTASGEGALPFRLTRAAISAARRAASAWRWLSSIGAGRFAGVGAIVEIYSAQSRARAQTMCAEGGGGGE
jgi:hypothetical protein